MTLKRALPIVLDTFFLLALAFWLGGLATLWFVAMPTMTAENGKIEMLAALSRLDGLIQFCGIGMICVQFLLRRRYQKDRHRYAADALRQALTFAAFLLALLPRFMTSSPILFDSTHMGLVVAQIILLAGIVALTVWLQSPRSVSEIAVK